LKDRGSHAKPYSDRGGDEENVSRHAATDEEKCEEMAEKYDWDLVRVEPTEDPILQVDCVFEGETQFPNYHEKQDR
jgi:hypothetical protein